MYIVARSSRGPRIGVRIVNKCLTCSGAEAIKTSCRHSRGVMIYRKWKWVRKSPGVCSRIVDLHCCRGPLIFVVTANYVPFAVLFASLAFLSHHRHRGAHFPIATNLRSARAGEQNPKQHADNWSGKNVSHGKLIQYFLQESPSEVPNKRERSEDSCLNRRK